MTNRSSAAYLWFACMSLLCSEDAWSQDPNYQACKTHLADVQQAIAALGQLGEFGGLIGEALSAIDSVKFDISYDDWSRNQPNPFLFGYKWKIDAETESITPGWSEQRMVATGEFVLSDKYESCYPALQGSYDAKVNYKFGPQPYCGGQTFTGNINGKGDISGNATLSELSIMLDGILEKQKYTSNCPFGNVEHEADFHLISSTSHSMPYKDGQATSSNPYVHLTSKITLQAECAVDLTTPSAVPVNVIANMPPVTYTHALSSTGIQGLAINPSSAANAGLTRVRTAPKLSNNTSGSHATFGGRVCMWIDSIDVDISFPSITVYIASEYPFGSCNYTVTLNHENDHVQKAKDLLQKHSAHIKNELAKAALPAKNIPLAANSFAQGQSQIDTLLKAIVDPLTKDLADEIEREYSAMDSPANYALVHSQCPTW